MRSISLAALALVAASLVVPGSGRPGVPSQLGLIALTGDLRPTLVPRVYAFDLPSGSQTDLAASEGGWDPALSPDGSRLAFVSDRDGFDAVYVSRPDGGDPRRLTAEIKGTPFWGDYGCPAGESNPVWSPDGREIVFELEFGPYCTPPTASARRLSAVRYTVADPHRLAVVEVDGSGLRVLDVDGFSPRWSPDGTRLAYVERSTVSFAVEPGKTSGIVRLGDGATRSLGAGTAPAWAPGGNALTLPTGKGVVDVFDADGSLVRSVRGADAAWMRCGLVVSRSGPVAISPDRRTAAFGGTGGVVERACGGRSRVVAGAGWQPLSFAPRGGRLLLTHYRRGRCSLAVAGGARLLVIGGPTAVQAPVWSPDGRRVVFLGVDGVVVVADASTGRATPVAVEGSDSEVTPPLWTDASTVVYSSRAVYRASNLYIFDPTSGTARLLARDARDPAWSPDGRTLAFETPSGTIALTGPAAGKPRLLPETEAAGFGLAWSPDGTQFAFSNGLSLRVADRAGSIRTVIGFAIAGTTLSAWSPDGRWLAYTVPSPVADPGVWLVHADGSDNHLFVPRASDLVWSPDGTRIAYIEDSRLWVADADGQAAVALPGAFEAAPLSWAGAGILAVRPIDLPTRATPGPFGQLLLVSTDGSSEAALTSASTSVSAATSQPQP